MRGGESSEILLLPPIADAGGPYYATLGVPVLLDGSPSTDPDGVIVGYMWDFDDDGTWDTVWLTSPTTTHTYDYAVGNRLRLQVIDNSGLTEFDWAPLTFMILPAADAGGPYFASVGEPVVFDASGSHDADGVIAGYRWDWENDATWDTDWITSPTSTHTFSSPFIGQVRVEVIDNNALTDSGTAAIGIGGTVLAWGDNGVGQCDVPAVNADFVAVAGGFYHSLGLKADGSIVAWGYNSYGQCDVPAPNADFEAVAAGYHHSLGLKTDGSIVAWGYNNYGQCDVPAPNVGFIAIASGYAQHNLGLKGDGSIVAWGYNGYGQCDVPSPNADFVAVAVGMFHSVGLKADGSVVAWGCGEGQDRGQCGVPVPNSDFVAVAAGAYHNAGLKADGSIVTWGGNDFGQCDIPQPNADFVAIAANGVHNLGLKFDGSIVAWGCGSPHDRGQCNVPSPNTGFLAVAAGARHSLAIRRPCTDVLDCDDGNICTDDSCVSGSCIHVNNTASCDDGLFCNGPDTCTDGACVHSGDPCTLPFVCDEEAGFCALPGPRGSIVAWGYNNHGQCNVPGPNTDFVSVSAGLFHNAALKADGSIVAWGDNNDGQCNVPIPNTDFVGVAAGSSNSLGLKADGSIVCWGYCTGGMSLPSPNTGFVAISAGGGHNLGLKSDGSIVTWGCSGDELLCNVPAPNADFTAVAAAGMHSLGLKADGSIVAWGHNADGQCNVPAPNRDFIAIAAGIFHSLGLKSDGSIVAWGSNFYLQCFVPNPNTSFVAVEAGAGHSLGLKADGSIVAWGENFEGQCNVPSPNTDFVAISGGFHHSLGLRAECMADCDDGNVCTGDTCALGVCVHLNNAALCDDGLFCTATDVCSAGACMGSGDSCPGRMCNETTDACVDCLVDADCNDGNICTDDTCVSGSCVHENNTVPCDDGRFCNGADTCAEGACLVHTGSACAPPLFCFEASNSCHLPGSIVAWGRNEMGQSNVPAPNSEFIAASGGWVHTLGLKANGSVVAWGANNFGQCNVPVPNSDYVAVAAGTYGSLALKVDGAVREWGQCCGGPPGPNNDFIAIVAPTMGVHSLGLKSDGSIVAWGDNGAGQCNVPPPNADFVAMAGGNAHSLGLKRDGSVVAWGRNLEGQCNVPAPNSDFVAIAAGEHHSLGLKADGSIVAWGCVGWNFGQCSVPSPNSGFVAIAAGATHNLALKPDGSIVAWGNNAVGQCNIPAPNRDFIDVAAGGYHTLGLRPGELVPPAVLPDPAAGKTRFISFIPGNAEQQTALMVTLNSLHHVDPPYTGGAAADFSDWEGHVRWVGPPQQYLESTASGVPFWASRLQCEPYYADWSTIGLLHVTGAEIIPSSQYDVQAVSSSCQGAETDCADVSTPLRIRTTRWGDVEIPYNPPSPTTQPDFADVAALVDKFKSLPTAPIKARALLSGQVPEMSLDFSFAHISDCVDAFRGRPYPYSGPCVCPSTITCDATPCSTPSPCPAGQLCVAGFCRDACERCTP